MILSERRQAWYAPILAASIALTLLRLMLLARMLDVPNFALLSGGLLVASTFSMLSCLGLYIVLLRDLPVLILRRQERRGALLLVQCILATVLCAAVAIGLAPLLAPLASLDASAFVLGVVYGVSQQAFLVVNTDCRSRGQLITFAQDNLLRSLAVFGCGLGVAWLTGSAWWVLLAEGTVSLLLVLKLGHAVLGRVQLQTGSLVRLAWRRRRQLPWRSAVVLAINSVVGFGILSADRWLAAGQLPTEQFARYSFVAVVLTCAQALQGLIGSAVFPAMARVRASSGNAGCFRVCSRASVGLLAISACLIPPAWWLLDLGVEAFYPVYGGSSSLLLLLLLVGAFRVADFWSTHLVVMQQESTLLFINIAAAVAGVLLWWACSGWTRESVPTADQVAWFALSVSAVTFAATALTAWALTRRHVGR